MKQRFSIFLSILLSVWVVTWLINQFDSASHIYSAVASNNLAVLTNDIDLHNTVPEASGQTKPNTLLQFVSNGHILGFSSNGVYAATDSHAYHVSFVEANVVPMIDGFVKHDDKNEAGSLRQITYPNLWKGISLTYEASTTGILHNTYFVSPGANPEFILLDYNAPIRLEKNGELVFIYDMDELREGVTYAWQEINGQHIPVDVSFRLLGSPRYEMNPDGLHHRIGFRLGKYNPAYSLFISTNLSWHTFLGGSGDDYGRAMAVDNEGNIYITGDSNSSWGNPIIDYSGGTNIFATKLNSSGVRQWNTFLGGGYGNAIVLDTNNNVYIAGHSAATWGDPIDPHVRWGDAFAAKLNSHGELQWNTFLGSAVNDYGHGIAVDGNGDVYVAGTSGANWGDPVNGSSGDFDAFAAKLSNDGTRQWNTYMGGSNSDYGQAIAVDQDGNVYVAGTSSTAWGTPVNAYAGSNDVFSAKLNSTGVRQWHTFMGSSGSDNGRGVTVDSSGNVYILGYSYSSWGQPVNAHAGGGWDAFTTKLDSNGVRQWHTFAGSRGTDYGYAITLDDNDNIYMAGTSYSSWGNPDNAYTDNGDAFAVKLNNDGTRLWNTFLGGAGIDYGQAIAVDSKNNIYLAGYSDGTWGVSAINDYQGGQDIFAGKIGGPDLSVLGNDTIIVNGDSMPSPDDNTDFEEVVIFTPVTHTFTISNKGIEDLILHQIDLVGNNGRDFTIDGIAIPLTVSPGLTTTFQVGFKPTILATQTATVTVEHNDPSENPFQFAIQGIGCTNPTTVQNANNNGTGSLRQALVDMCSGGLIIFSPALSGQTIILEEQLDIQKDLTIYGNVPITISGNTTTRVFNVLRGHATFDSLTIADGYVQITDCDANVFSQCGGGIMMHNNNVVVTVTNSTLTDNTSPVLGGGIFNSGGRLVIQNSTLNNNSAYNAGGIYNYAGTLILRNSTLSGNSGSNHSGGLFNAGGQLHLSNTIIANSPSGGDCNTNRTVSTNDHNLIESIGGSACSISNGAGGSIIGVDPQLSPLGWYGGSTPTMALLPGSRAIHAGNPATCLSIDQRGVVRLENSTCDIGAYENGSYLLTTGVLGQGTVTSDPSASEYQAGSVVTVTAIADSGWTFFNWSGDLSDSNNPQTVTIDGNKVVTATFINNPPIAIAGEDKILEAESLVTLDGSGSHDEDPDQTLDYAWVQTGGPAVSLSSSTSVTNTFTAPALSTILTFTLTVTDNYGVSGIADEVVITVLRPGVAVDVQSSKTIANMGDTITYTYRITNVGDVHLADIFSIDNRLGNLFLTPIELAPGQQISKTLTYSVVETDLPGPLVNTILVSGTSPIGNLVAATTTVAVPISSHPGMTAKLTSSISTARPGETITYTLALTNSGDVTLYNLSSETTVPGNVILPDSLAPETTIHINYQYLVLATDLPGPLTNTVTVRASPAVGEILSVTEETIVLLKPHTVYIPIIVAR